MKKSTCESPDPLPNHFHRIPIGLYGSDARHRSQIQRPQLVSNSIIKQALVMLLIYFSLGMALYSSNREGFSGVETHPVIDAFYFCIVTVCTIGYGDIAPLTPVTKAFTCLFVLFGFGLGFGLVLRAFANYVLDLQEYMILANIPVRVAGNYIVDTEKGRMRIRTKVGLALLVVISCIGTGTLILYFVENMDWIDSIYLSVMSVTTVGYGDRVFKTLVGRLIALLWLLVSTLAIAWAFLYLAEARINKRHWRITKLVLRDMTVEEFLVNNHGFISKSKYVLDKLKELRKIADKDIQQICTQFNKLDTNNSGRIMLPDTRAMAEKDAKNERLIVALDALSKTKDETLSRVADLKSRVTSGASSSFGAEIHHMKMEMIKFRIALAKANLQWLQEVREKREQLRSEHQAEVERLRLNYRAEMDRIHLEKIEQQRSVNRAKIERLRLEHRAKMDPLRLEVDCLRLEVDQLRLKAGVCQQLRESGVELPPSTVPIVANAMAGSSDSSFRWPAP